MGAQQGKDKMDNITLKKVWGTSAVDEVSVEGFAGTKGGDFMMVEVLSEAAAPLRGFGSLVLDSDSSSTTAWPLERRSARFMLDSLPKVSYVEDGPDVVWEALASRPSRVRLQGVLRRLPDELLCIAKGSSKYGLELLVWVIPIRFGRGGDCDHCKVLLRRNRRESPALLACLPELRGKKLACHHGMHEGCQGDVLMQEFAAIAEEHWDDADATTDEDEDGLPEPGLGAGLHGVGPPFPAEVGARGRGLRDEGGLCSPGCWPPWRRKSQPRSEDVEESINTISDEAIANYGKDFEVKLVSSLVCLRVEADPPRGLDGRARVAVEKLRAKNGFVRDGLPNHPGAEVDFELTAALAKCLEDPDAKPPPPRNTGLTGPPTSVRMWWSPSGLRTTPARGTSKTR